MSSAELAQGELASDISAGSAERQKSRMLCVRTSAGWEHSWEPLVKTHVLLGCVVLRTFVLL
jgi:hypothetical protein